MQLRRFTADSTPAALGAVRLALGDDAIILANRKIGDQVEIIATGQMEDGESLAEISLDAVEHKSQKSSVNRKSTHGSGTVTQANTSKVEVENDTLTVDGIAAVAESVENGLEPVNDAYSRDVKGRTSTAENDVQPLSVNLSENTDANEVGATEPLAYSDVESALRAARPKRSVDDIDVFKQEIHTLSACLNNTVSEHKEQITKVIEAQTDMINQYFKGLEVNLWGNTSPTRTLHLQQLLSLGIGAELAVRLVERALPDQSIDDALRQSLSLLKSTLPIGNDKTFTVPGITIMSGPPGAGKTTALMKMAMQHIKKHGADSIVVVCADTRRIGAFDELQAYGRLLGVPTVHAHDSSELDSLLLAFTHKKLVLVDHTLPLHEDSVEIPAQLFRPELADSVRQLFVISATMQSASLDSLIRSHCQHRSMQCVLTHLDSSARLGEMFNAIIRHHLPIAYWSDAASIQEPLHKAEASVLIATSVAMSKRLQPTPDDEWLLRLVQPSDQMMEQSMNMDKNQEVNA